MLHDEDEALDASQEVFVTAGFSSREE